MANVHGLDDNPDSCHAERMDLKRSWSTVAFCGTLALGCGAQQNEPGVAAEIDASRGDGSCATRDAPLPSPPSCSTNADCIARFAPLAPSGTLYAVCMHTMCQAAERCVFGYDGADTYCVCGAEDLTAPVPGEWGCSGASPLCVRAEGQDAAHCVPACPSH